MITIGFFSTCLVDSMRPSVGLAAIKLLRGLNYEVSVPKLQSCCGQPGYNNGDGKGAFKIAKQVIESFHYFDYLIAPSGSCLGMIKHHYPQLMEKYGNEEDITNANDLARRSRELISFLESQNKFRPQALDKPLKVTYHDSCSGLRELGIKQQPRKLLASQKNVKLIEMNKTEVCCGFGGTFCVKNTPVSDRMADTKLDSAVATGADVLLAGDLGCLIHMASRSLYRKLPIRLLHTAELLAGYVDIPAIGEQGTIDWKTIIGDSLSHV